MVKERRKKLAALLPDNSITLCFSGKAPYKVGDEKYEFSVDRNFFYFTGLDKENMVMALVKAKGLVSEYLFIERYDEELAKWIGGRLLPEEAQKISNISNIHWFEEAYDTLGSCITRLYNRFEQVDVFADFTKQEAFQADSEAVLFTRELLARYPYISLRNVAPKMSELRLIKDETEIKSLKKAIEVTRIAIENMMQHAEAGMHENHLEAYFDFVLKINNCKHSFPSIVAGGKNATILHYIENNQKIKDRSLVLCDLGAANDYMNADITRTFPVNGKFTKRQRQIYDIVLKGNKLIMDMVKPGLTLRDLDNELVRYYHEELKALGLLKHGKSVQDYYWHSVSHMLGLETHDVTMSDYPLQVGNVFTIEPGLYLEDENIGIRIEDNVLVTEDGCINLSEDIIKEADEIEAYMAQFQEEE